MKHRKTVRIVAAIGVVALILGALLPLFSAF
jgi:hypothetical protein